MPNLQIEFLTQDEADRDVCRLYWEINENGKFVNQVPLLRRRLELSPNEFSTFIKRSCWAYSPDAICPLCQNPRRYNVRSEYSPKGYAARSGHICADCASAQIRERQQQQLAIVERKNASVRGFFSVPEKVHVDMHSLSFEQAIYLLSFIRIGAADDFSSYGPLNATSAPLSPSYDIEILNQLHNDGLLLISPNSPIEAFEFENDKPVKMFTNYVEWSLAVGTDLEENRRFIIQLENTLKTKEWWPYKWHSQKLQLWRKVALHECLEYLQLMLGDHQLQIKVGSKLCLVLEQTLNSYSAGQTCNLTWRAARDAAAFYMRVGNKSHAANTVISSIQRQADKGIADAWDVTSFRRDRRRPQSMVSQVLFDTALQIGTDGFDQIPRFTD